MEILEADYVIAGGGAAGCVLAARLSEDPDISVIVLEAGPHYRGLPIHMPAALGALYEKGAYHWSYRSKAEPHAANKVLPYKLGRILGGSSAINGLVWVRGNPLDYDDWEASGCPGWGYGALETIFRKVERFEDPTDKQMGLDGPIPVTAGRPQEQPLTRAFMLAAEQAGERINPNHNSGDQEGFCALHRNTGRGQRGDVYQGYIKPILGRPNLMILADCTVRRILLDGKRAIAVEAGRKGRAITCQASREILLCAGALASPQLLEVSGIGNREILESAGIRPLHHLPGVGENFHAHPTIAMTFTVKKPLSILNSTRPLGKLLAGLRWLLTREGPAATNHFEAGAFLKSRPELDRPDYQLTFLPLALGDTTNPVDQHGFQVYVELIGCRSRGRTHATSPDIADQPDFCFNYLEDPRDVAVYRRAVATIRRLVAQAAFEDLVEGELVPGRDVTSKAGLEDWIRKCAGFSHHLVGSCKMGPAADPLAVVGPDLRLHGVENLRVVDASIMPKVPSGNTQAATIAIAEKAAEMIRG